MKEIYTEKKEEVVARYSSDIKNGLSEEKVLARREKYGRNEFKKKKKENIFLRILAQFKDVSIIILLVAAALSLALAIKDGHGYVEPAVIFIIIAMNIALALYQEYSAEKSLEALSKLSSPHCRVLREGKVKEIETSDVVPGDILILKSGDLVPADCRLVKSDSFSVDESSLTGESEPVKKDADKSFDEEVTLGDRINMAYSSCLVMTGNAVAIATEIGMNTEVGKIAKYLNEKKKIKSPLQIRLNKISKAISMIAVMSAIVLFVLGFLPSHSEGLEFWDRVMVAITLAVAAVPETLSLIVTMILTKGVKRMVAKNALIVKLQSVETLGSVSVICSDKTGTLTMNKMTIKKLYVLDEEAINEDDPFTDNYKMMLDYLVLCSNTTIGKDDNGNEKIIGDSTETAIIALAKEKKVDIDKIRKEYKRVKEIPFSSDRKLMSVIVKDPKGGYIAITKGAFDRLHYVNREDRNYQHKLELVHNFFANQALRVISLGYRHFDKLPKTLDEKSIEEDLNFMGFIGIIDPARPEATKAIACAKKAGIKTVMITGDHATTAGAIARELGIINGKDGIITGKDLSMMSDDQLAENIELYSVYARVTPEDKIRIVKARQSRGEVVAMTGDGVNDAPALKAADVGIAMGINGTEVSKNAADMILTDDNFATIIEAVHEGRNVFSNIRKLIYFLLVCNMSEVLMMLLSQFFNRPLILSPTMLLLINVVGDGIPGLALANEISDPRIMERKPIERNESFLGGGLLEVIITQIFVFAAASLAAFYIGWKVGLDGQAASEDIGRTMAFIVTGWTSILHVLTVRSRKSLFKYRFKDNPQIYISVVAMLVLFAGFTLIPGMNSALGFSYMGLFHRLITIALSLLPIVVAEYGKFWDFIKLRSMERNKVEEFRSYRDE